MRKPMLIVLAALVLLAPAYLFAQTGARTASAAFSPVAEAGPGAGARSAILHEPAGNGAALAPRVERTDEHGGAEHHEQGEEGEGEHEGGGFAVLPYYGSGYGYSPFWGWNNGWGPSYYDYHSPTGKVKIKDAPKDAQVYVNGSYAGTVGRLKTFKLAPGSYNLEVREKGRDVYHSNVYVVNHKTIDVWAAG